MRVHLALVAFSLALIFAAGSARATANVTLVSPANGNVSNVTTGTVNYTFNCSANSSLQLANFSLWINSTGSWAQNQMQNKTGTWNFSIFNLTLGQGYYIWNCRAGDNSSNYNFSSQNWTILVNNVTDVLPPNVTLISPANGNTSNVATGYINYTFNCSATDDVQLSNISLWINSTGAWAENQTVNVSGTWNFSVFNLTLGPGYYIWNCRVGDNSSNYNFSSQNWTILVNNATDAIPPNVSLVSPADGNVSNTLTAINYTFNCSATDDVQLANISLWINSTGNWSQNQSQNVSGTWNFSTFNLSLVPGYYIWNCRARDNSSNYNFSSQNRTILVTLTDIIPPGLWFTSPSGNRSATPKNWIFVNVSANETLNASVLDWYNGTWHNVSMNVNGSNSWINMTGLADGIYYFRVYANDSAGNWNVTEDRSITVDTIYPAINITSPQNGTVYSNNSLYLNFTYNETNPGSCWYQYNGTNSTLANCTNTTFTALDNQQSEIWLWMNDTAGNLNSSSVTFSVCAENWSCSGWSTCSGNVQARTCTDARSCGTIINRPLLSQFCGDVPGGGGGGSGPAEPPEVQKTWDKLEPGLQVSFSLNKSGLDFSEIRIEVLNQANNVSIKVTKLESKPIDIPYEAPGRVYQYVAVNTSNLNQNNMKSAGIRFMVAKSWISANNIDVRKVYLNRYFNGAWKRLNTGYDGEDGQNFYYFADTPGFSYFVITGEIRAPSVPIQNQTQNQSSGACNDNGVCERGENASCADCRLQKQCENGMFMCHGSNLDGCGQDGKWVTYMTCKNGCLNARCLEVEAAFVWTQELRAALLVLLSSSMVVWIVVGIRYKHRHNPFYF